MKNFFRSVGFALSIFVFFQALAWPAQKKTAQVQWVADGDTFRLANGEMVRLIGVDSPEYQPHRGLAERFGKEAAEFTRRKLLGKRVLLEGDLRSKDKYGRLLEYVYLEDGVFFNRLLAAEGLAEARAYPPNLLHQSELEKAEKEAAVSRKGMWGRRLS